MGLTHLRFPMRSLQRKHGLPELICDTSVLQYLHQLGKLETIRELASSVVVPVAVAEELDAGIKSGVDLPEIDRMSWIETRRPTGEPAIPLVRDMGPGETEVLMLAIEEPNTVAVLDDKLARRVARISGVEFTGTLGLLLDAKSKGLIGEIRPLLDKLDALRFHVSETTRESVLRMAGER